MLPANITQLTAALKRTQEFAQAAAGNSTYLKMDKGGYWTIGTDELRVEDDSQWAVNPESFATGYSAFDDNGTRVGEEMALMSEEPIITASLPQVNARWIPQLGMQVKCLNGEDKGEEGLIYQRSRSGIESMTAILAEMTDRIVAGEAECIPVISLGTDSYKHSKYGKIYTAVFTIVRWIAPDGEEEVVQEVVEEKPRARKAAARQATQEAAEVEQETEEEAAPQPARRRRRA